MQDLIVEAGKNLSQVIAEMSFKFWKEDKFRRFIDFERMSQTEQDRVFNELEVSALGLWLLKLDIIHEESTYDDDKKMIEKIRTGLIAGFLKLYEDLGIESKFIKDWKTLIDMRLRQYRSDYKLLLSELKKNKDHKDDAKVLAMVQTIILDCVSHIRRGELEQDDPIIKLVRLWVLTLNKMFEEFSSKLTSSHSRES